MTAAGELLRDGGAVSGAASLTGCGSGADWEAVDCAGRTSEDGAEESAVLLCGAEDCSACSEAPVVEVDGCA